MCIRQELRQILRWFIVRVDVVAIQCASDKILGNSWGGLLYNVVMVLASEADKDPNWLNKLQ